MSLVMIINNDNHDNVNNINDILHDGSYNNYINSI